jgi:hypothetical protein
LRTRIELAVRPLTSLNWRRAKSSWSASDSRAFIIGKQAQQRLPRLISSALCFPLFYNYRFKLLPKGSLQLLAGPGGKYAHILQPPGTATSQPDQRPPPPYRRFPKLITSSKNKGSSSSSVLFNILATPEFPLEYPPPDQPRPIPRQTVAPRAPFPIRSSI